jgi:hypothetical protein
MSVQSIIPDAADAIASGLEAMAAMSKEATERAARIQVLEAELATAKQASQTPRVPPADADLVAGLLARNRLIGNQEKAASSAAIQAGGQPKLMLALEKLAALIPPPLSISDGAPAAVTQFGPQQGSAKTDRPLY